jgi:uncharacterized protein YjhX (UPF0386 family)
MNSCCLSVSADVCIYSKERTFDGINLNNTLLYEFKQKYEGRYVVNTINNKCYYVIKILYNDRDCFVQKEYNPNHGGNVCYLLEYNKNDDFFDIMMIECYNNIGIANEKCYIATFDEVDNYKIIEESEIDNYLPPVKKIRINNVRSENVDEVGWVPTVPHSRPAVIEEYDHCIESLKELVHLWENESDKFDKECCLSNYIMFEFCRIYHLNSFHIVEVLHDALLFYSRKEIIHLFTNIWPFILTEDNIERLNEF